MSHLLNKFVNLFFFFSILQPYDIIMHVVVRLGADHNIVVRKSGT